MTYRMLPALVLLILLGACKPTGTYQLDPVSLPLTATTEKAVATAVIDRRPYVLDGDESPGFLGTERGNWGGQKIIKTESGRALADELNDAVLEAMANRGIAAGPVPVVKDVKGGPLEAFRSQPSDRLLLVEIRDWRTDVYTRIRLRWSLEASVYDGDGNLLAKRATQGRVSLAGSNMKAEYASLATDELSAKLTNLLNKRAITDALR